MITKKLIIFALFFSYSLILSHGIIHHDHHESDHCINVYKIFSDHDHCPNNDHSLHDLYKNYNHTANKEVFTLRGISSLIKVFPSKIQSEILLQDNLNSNNPPPCFFITNENSEINSNRILFSYKGLRAPPLS
jgi:hypothetical protein